MASARHVAIVGAGVFGATAALELRRRGWAVTLLDTGPVPHPDASSNDVSRMVRTDYGSDLFYHELAETALEGWHRWNVEWDVSPYHQDGVLVLSRSRMRPGGFEFESYCVLRERGYRPTRMNASALARDFPAWGTGLHTDGYLNPRGGWVESSTVLAHLLTLARANGVKIRETPVTGILSNDARALGVTAADGSRITSDRVVLAAGAWTPAIFPELSHLLRTVGQPLIHFRPDDPSLFQPARFPPWAADIANTGWYGFPALPDGRVKVGHHGEGIPMDPRRRDPVPAEHVDRCRAFLADALPALAGAPAVQTRTCLYCDSVDGDFLIAVEPGLPGLVVAGGGSGHAFKFAPVLGSLIADVVEGRDNRWLHRFRWREPGGHPSEQARHRG